MGNQDFYSWLYDDQRTAAAAAVAVAVAAYADQKLKEKIEVAELLMRKMSQFQDQPSTDHHLQEQEQEAQGNIHDPEPIQEKGGDNHVDDTVTSQDPGRPSLGELSAVEENEGFRSPTSIKHKIPAITECPPAPRKPTATRAIPMKRRISKVPRRLQFEEFEVLIPPKILASLLSRLMKPSRDERK
ncbi:hypothetical protein VitviT2T_028811 [Vitis vinifera]|uniref:Uncharacterized protein n=1 Tax=Vitis vinifera TaxID=29760 RepID=A0ABY9DUQ9_VITVI|nr:hypothetical protein VitviT2T_028811 [Vitis vinifera]